MKLGWIIALPALLISLHGAEETYPLPTTKTKSINEAIDAGCEFLKEKQNPDGSWGSAHQTKGLNTFVSPNLQSVITGMGATQTARRSVNSTARSVL